MATHTNPNFNKPKKKIIARIGTKSEQWFIEDRNKNINYGCSNMQSYISVKSKSKLMHWLYILMRHENWGRGEIS